MKELFKPGTKEAREQCCECPKDQPQAFQGLYWYNECCPYHGEKMKIEKFLERNKFVLIEQSKFHKTYSNDDHVNVHIHEDFVILEHDLIEERFEHNDNTKAKLLGYMITHQILGLDFSI